MKKNVFLAISVLCILLAVFIPFSMPHQVYAKGVREIVTIDEMETFLSRAGVNRTSSTKNEKLASTYLAEVMQQTNLVFYGNLNSYLKEFSTKNGKSQNVIGVKKSSADNAKKIILGAHYDNAFILKDEQTGSNGVFDNASGVVCLLGIMKALESYNLSFDVIYVFYGAEETGFEGSSNFVNSLSYIDKKNVLLAFNFDSLGVGDYTYYFAGDSADNYKVLFSNNVYGIKEMPMVKRINLLSNLDNLAYTHVGLSSDNVSYLKNNVRCITFFSGNLTHSGSGYIESTQNEDIMHTKNDNLDYIIENYPNFIKDINSVANLTVDVVTSADFEQVLKRYDNEINLFFFNNKFVIGGIFTIGFMILVSLKQKKEIKG